MGIIITMHKKVISAIGKSIVQQTFRKQRVLIKLNCQLKRVQYGEIQLYLPKTELAEQHHGFIHGGIITTLADSAAGLAGVSLLEEVELTCITVELKINFLRPAHSDVYCIGKVLKQNKSFTVTTGEVFNKDNKLCAFMVQTLKTIGAKDFVKKS